MTGLRSRKNRKQLFQNLRMGNEIVKMMKKLLNPEGNVFDDIVEVIVKLKMTIYELEDIGKKVLNDTNEIKEDTAEENNTIIADKSCFQIMKCNFCESKFKNISELERHIMEQHEEFETYDCDLCKKKFVTRWRLEKHAKMHSNLKIKICRYASNNEPCPFDKLGCKFKHVEPDRKVKDKVGHMEENPDTSSEVTNDKLGKDELEKKHAFFTSTPKKSVDSSRTKDPNESKILADCQNIHL